MDPLDLPAVAFAISELYCAFHGFFRHECSHAVSRPERHK